MKTVSEFKRERRDGKYVYVKRLSIGGEVHKERSEFYAFDAAGNYLGFTNDKDEAEYMAHMGYTNLPAFEPASRISLALAWDDAVAAGCRVLLAPDGEQIVALDDEAFLMADTDGEVELLSDVELFERFGDSEHAGECIYTLKVISNDDARRLT